jgi:hypothetical protein
MVRLDPMCIHLVAPHCFFAFIHSVFQLLNERMMAAADTSLLQSAAATVPANPSAAVESRQAAKDSKKAKAAERIGVNNTSTRRR